MPNLNHSRAMRFHLGFEAYTASPMVRPAIDGAPVWVKDETERMGLGAFKAIGGTYAVAQLLGIEMGFLDPMAVDLLASDAPRPTFVCASAGNHGMAVAEGARIFGAGCRIHLSDTVPEAFVARLQAKGAEVVRSGSVYEESIAAAIEDAKTTGAVHLADGSWPGYTEPPRLVMEGYTVMAEEMREAFEAQGAWPSHVYLQAGVGGMAAAVAYMIRQNWAVQPQIIVVEPEAAPCLRDSKAAGALVTVEGPVSIQGRLDCKAPSMLAHDILSKTANRYVTVTDTQAQEAADLSAEIGIASTPSGAAGLAALLADRVALDPPPKAPLVILSEGLEAA